MSEKTTSIETELKPVEKPAEKPQLNPPCPAISGNIVSEINWLFERLKSCPLSLDDHQRCQRVLGSVLQHVGALEDYVRKAA